jgi:hypothetical protein
MAPRLLGLVIAVLGGSTGEPAGPGSGVTPGDWICPLPHAWTITNLLETLRYVTLGDH